MLSNRELTNEAPSAPGATHQTARTQSVEVDGVRFAYRRFGAGSVLPLVMLQHFRGNLDNWDPALTDALAREREVILVDYPGTGASSGEFGPTIADTARRMIAFLTALQLSEIDLLGFSIGGFVAQEIALIRPMLTRRLILAATGPKGAPGMHGWRQDIAAAARDAQYDAIVDWGIPDHAALQRLTGIQSPTLVIQGDSDLMIPTKLSHLLAGLIPHVQIRVYPDAAHGFLFQYPSDVAAAVNTFLTADDEDMRGAS